MKTVYRYLPETPLNPARWAVVFRAQSFDHACRVCRDLTALNPGARFCVNS